MSRAEGFELGVQPQPPLVGETGILLAQQYFGSALAGAGRRYQVCAGTGCVSNAGLQVLEALQVELDGRTQGDHARQSQGWPEVVSITGCQGFCAQGPLVRVEPGGLLCTGVRPATVPEMVGRIEAGEGPPVGLAYRDPRSAQTYPREREIPFYAYQQRVTLQRCGAVDPEEIRTYLAHGGYGGLAKALFQMTPEGVIAEVSESRLRGRGGAGFPTGEKWRLTRAAPGEVKYIICNGSESAPDAFTDGSIMEGDPHAVLEGMTIAGYAVGALQGFVCVRREYALAVRRLKGAIAEARQWGLLGPSVAGTPFAFDIQVREGAGAFISGEETGLIRSVQGERATPFMRPPYPSERGLWGHPTCVNNVETLATVPVVIGRGASWYAGLGTPESGGTTVFSLTGAIRNSGAVEVPLGTPLRHVVERIGGGVREGRAIKGVQVGGPSGGCLPEELLDTPVDYADLARTGAIMGSGGMVVVDDTTCMVDLARFFLSLTHNESCGMCVPCRVGTRKMLRILTRIAEGQGRPDDLDRLEQLAKAVGTASLCGLGRTAPNPILTTLRYFKAEYQAHILDRHCPAGVCAALAVPAGDGAGLGRPAGDGAGLGRGDSR